ncbi:MAG: ECF transporter S component [bacterium]|jgi:riboflavin transporter FmnP|nr:ECF transporter S component [Bacillota bacterium]HHW54874.1 ECF transporter S component [Bacillota bacterium]
MNVKVVEMGQTEFNTRSLVKMAVLAALGAILMLIEVRLPVFPGILKLELGDLPALLGSLAMGPLAGVIIELLKNIMNLLLDFTFTFGVGELSNFIVGSAFVASASIVYQRSRDKRGLLLGLLTGIFCMTLTACFSNYYIVIPAYMKAGGFSLEKIVELFAMANSRITDLRTIIIYAIIPFNLLKSTVVSIVALLIYNKVLPVLHR